MALLIVSVLIVIAIGFSTAAILSITKIKKEARAILKLGQIDNMKQFKRITMILGLISRSTGDPEAEKLWKELETLAGNKVEDEEKSSVEDFQFRGF